VKSDASLDFIGVGVAKSGSSWISHILNQHPDIYMPPRKELNVFNPLNFQGKRNHYYTENTDEIALHFSEAPERAKWGEFSPQYFRDATAQKRIATEYPRAKIIIVLRDPIKRVQSHLQYDQEFNRIIPAQLTPEQAIEAYPYLLEQGDYADGIAEWLLHFPLEQIFICRLESAVQSPLEFSSDLFRFLGLSPLTEIDSSPSNERKAVKSGVVHGLLALPGKFDKIFSKWGAWRRLKHHGLYRRLLDARWALADRNIAPSKAEVQLSQPMITRLSERYAAVWVDVNDLVGSQRWI
jgi:hypothetical protein